MCRWTQGYKTTRLEQGYLFGRKPLKEYWRFAASGLWLFFGTIIFFFHKTLKKKKASTAQLDPNFSWVLPGRAIRPSQTFLIKWRPITRKSDGEKATPARLAKPFYWTVTKNEEGGAVAKNLLICLIKPPWGLLLKTAHFSREFRGHAPPEKFSRLKFSEMQFSKCLDPILNM